MRKRALVLSGGGLFAAFQAGAWKVMAPHFRPDVVIGVSAGALNAWPIAAQMEPEELCDLWRQVDRGGTCALRFRWPRYWGDGVLNCDALEKVVTCLTRDRALRVPLGVTVCEGLRLRQRLYRDEEIRPEHLLASCALPFLLPARTLSGRLSFDGGLRDVCPIWAAEECGATEILALDVLTHVPWWLGRGRTRQPDPPHVFRIAPMEPLAPLSRAGIWEPGAIDAWMARGEADAGRALAARPQFARQ